MGLILYSVSFFFLIIASALYMTRQRWMPLLPDRAQDLLYDAHPSNWMPASITRYTPLPTNFREDVEAGLHSADFDMTGNVEGDSRSGLDQEAKTEVLRIMKQRGVGFDEGRRIYMERSFRKSGIGADGLPRDPKLVTFS